jgi:hypothetical protein
MHHHVGTRIVIRGHLFSLVVIYFRSWWFISVRGDFISVRGELVEP